MQSNGIVPNNTVIVRTMNGRRLSVTQEVIGYSDITGFSGTHSVLDWATLRQGALGGEDDVAAYRELETMTESMMTHGATHGDTRKMTYIEPLGNRCYDTRVFATDDFAAGSLREEKGDEGDSKAEGMKEDVKEESYTPDEPSAGMVVKVEEDHKAVEKHVPTHPQKSDGELGVSQKTGGKRGRPRSTGVQGEKRKYTADELNLPSQDWKAYFLLDGSAHGNETLVYHSPEGIPCYSVEMMAELDGMRSKKIHVDKCINGLMRDVRVLQIYPIFTGIQQDSMGRDMLLLYRISKARKKQAEKEYNNI